MTRERFAPRETRGSGLRELLPVIAALIAVGLPDVARAEAPEPETIGTAEIAPETRPEERAETQKEIFKQAEACRKAYDHMKEAINHPVWLVIDTAAKTGRAEDHALLAGDGFTALQKCFDGTGKHPRVAQLIRSNSRETGVSLYPVDGSSFADILGDAEENAKKLRGNLTLDLTQNNPQLTDLRKAVGGNGNLLETWENIDSVSLGYSMFAPARWEFNGQIGVATGDESAVIVRGSGGVETVLTPVEGGRTTVGVAGELSRRDGEIDAAAGAYLLMSLGEHRPDLVVSVLAHPDDGKLGLKSEMALRFSRETFTREK